ncbi:SDR family oxidoreductase [Streptomyces flaveolus]|uniref:SDR family oxidoreductase n=1 Tax=Streptomyces flaveolus TaxID=67297 RepID=UPI0038091E60
MPVAINVTSAFLGIAAARDAQVAAAPSSLVNVSSDAELQDSPAMHGYAASKFALRGPTKSLALELGGDNVRANSMHPGVIQTPMTSDLDLGDRGGALGRAGEPKEVSALVVYLASEESSFQTGAEFVIDGSQTTGGSAEV